MSKTFVAALAAVAMTVAGIAPAFAFLPSALQANSSVSSSVSYGGDANTIAYNGEVPNG